MENNTQNKYLAQLEGKTVDGELKNLQSSIITLGCGLIALFLGIAMIFVVMKGG